MKLVGPSAADIEAAATRLTGYVRRTPVIEIDLDGVRVVLKLEYLQHGGSFKVRGALNRMLLASPAALSAGVVTASGGNHGIAVALAAKHVGHAATVYIPERAPVASERRIEAAGARCIRHGLAWDDAWDAALAHAAEHGGLAVHPFEDDAVIAGQATVGVELLDEAPHVDGIVVAIGGGGLIAGVALAAHHVRPGMAIVGVEPTGAASMHESLRAGAVQTLAEVTTIAGTLAPRRVGPTTYTVCAAHVREVVLISDDEMRAGMRWLWDELRVLVEPAGAAALMALRSGRMATKLERPAIIVCGANPDNAEAQRIFA